MRHATLAVLVLGLVGLALAPPRPEKVLNPTKITESEVVALEGSFHAIETHIELIRDAALGIPNSEKGAQIWSLAVAALGKADAHRAEFADAWMWDEVEPPVDPGDPPVDPGDPPVVDPGMPYAVAPAFLSGEYGWMGPAAPAPGFALLGWWGELIGHYGEVEILGAGAEKVGNNAAANWGDCGPLWVYRLYDASGLFGDMKVWRAGDWTKGREGHVLYANVLASLTVRDLHAVECGAQAVQLVWRALETAVPPEDWHHADHTITLENVRATDMGLINGGESVRASWPFSIFNPGQSIVVRGCTVETIRAPLAHGALFVGQGEAHPETGMPTRTPSLVVEDLRVRVRNSDRAEVMVWGVDDATLTRLDIAEEGGEANVAIVDDCGIVRVIEPAQDLVIGIHAISDPHREPYKTYRVAAGTTWTWSGEDQ